MHTITVKDNHTGQTLSLSWSCELYKLKQLCLIQQGQDQWRNTDMNDDEQFMINLEKIVRREWPMFKRFVNYRDHLTRARVWVDIGSGLGICNLLLSQLYPNITFYLIDRDQLINPVGSDFYSEQGQNFYNDSSVFLNCIAASQLNPDQFVFLDPDDAWPQQVDIVASFRSYCWHYGLSQYWQRVQDHLIPGGLLTLDVSQPSQATVPISEEFGEPVIRYQYAQSVIQTQANSRITWIRPH